MKIHEYQAKELFGSYGIPVPQGKVATTPADARAIAEAIGGVVAVKSQVHVGGRGKAGGIKIAANGGEAEAAASNILGMDIKGCTVNKVLVEPGADIAREAYLGLIVDRGAKSVCFIGSAEGGVEIEVVAATHPEKILLAHSTDHQFPEAGARTIAAALFGDEATVEPTLDIMRKLWTLFLEKDCSLAEINPLVVTGAGEVKALDGKINFDDNALFKHDDIVALRDMDEENADEIEAREKGLSYIELDGDIGCMVNGAGLAMATLDMIALHGGAPANFLDVGGSSNPEKVVNAFKLILGKGNVKGVMINIFGGITRCDDIARGILKSFEQITIDVPVVVRLSGTNADEGRALLAGSDLISAQTFGDAVAKVVSIAKGNAA
jgi:succinyl-CoA synthetase beta subunit